MAIYDFLVTHYLWIITGYYYLCWLTIGKKRQNEKDAFIVFSLSGGK